MYSNIKKKIHVASSLLLATLIVSCSNNSINTTSLNSNKTSISKDSHNLDLNKAFKIKFSSEFNSTAYFLTYQDIRDSIKNKTIPDSSYHYYYVQNSEPQRLTNPTYLEVKGRVESGEFSEDAYLIANPDIKLAVDSGTIASGYQHWYSYAITNESTRKTKQEYVDAKSAIDAGFNEKAYRFAYPDIDNLVKTKALASAYVHWNTYAKSNETTRLSSTRYIQIKNAIVEGYDESAYLLAYPDVKSQVTSGFFPKGIDHYIDNGVNETRLERDNYQAAKLAILNDFDESRYLNAFPDVVSSGLTGFEHFRLYGRYEGRLQRQAYLDTKEFRVNSYITDQQINSSVATDNSGNFVVTWQRNISPSYGIGIYGQRYNSAGTPQGSEFKVNTYTTSANSYPSVAMSSSGNFIVAWQSEQDGDGYGVYGQRYNSDGTPQGSEFKINTFTVGNQGYPSAAIDISGNFVVTWQSFGQDGSAYGVYGQRYNSTGIPQGSEFKVNSYTNSAQFNSTVSRDSTGNFVVTWQSFGQDGSNLGVYGQRYNSTGIPQGSEFRINDYTTNVQINPCVVMDSTGNFIVTWQSFAQDNNTYNIYAKRYKQ